MAGLGGRRSLQEPILLNGFVVITLVRYMGCGKQFSLLQCTGIIVKFADFKEKSGMCSLDLTIYVLSGIDCGYEQSFTEFDI